MVLAIMAVDYLDRPSAASGPISPREATAEPAREKVANAPTAEPQVAAPVAPPPPVVASAPVAVPPPEPPRAAVAVPAPALVPPPVALRANAETRRSKAAEAGFALARNGSRMAVRGDALSARMPGALARIAVLADLRPSASVAAAPTVAFEMSTPAAAPTVAGIALPATEVKAGGETTSSLARPAAIPVPPNGGLEPARAVPQARAAAPRPVAKPARAAASRAKPAKKAAARAPAKPETTGSVRRPAPRAQAAPTAQPYTLPSALRP